MSSDVDRRFEELDRRRVEQIDQAHRALAAAQDKSYWLDRWHVDLNAVMARPGAAELRALLRGLRSVYRFARQAPSRLPDLGLGLRGIRREIAEDRASAARILAEKRAAGGADAVDVVGGQFRGGQSVLALDAAGNGLAAQVRGAHPEVAWQVVGPGQQPPLSAGDGSFDHALALGDTGALEWLPEVHRLVRPGGRFVLAAPAPDQLLGEIGAGWHMVGYHGTRAGRDLYVLERV